MELKQLWSVVRRRWWLILLPALVALILTLPSIKNVISSSSGGYSVTIRFTAGQTPTTDTAKTFQDQSYIPWLASEYVVNNLATWMKTDSFAQEISNELKAQGQTISADAIRGVIQSDSARSIMTLTFTSWPDPDVLKQIAQAAIDVLQNKNQVYFNPQFGTQRAAVIPLDTINVTPVPTALATRFTPLVRILIGLVAGIALAFLAEYLDPTLRSRSEVEALGLPVIAEIPRH